MKDKDLIELLKEQHNENVDRMEKIIFKNWSPEEIKTFEECHPKYKVDGMHQRFLVDTPADTYYNLIDTFDTSRQLDMEIVKELKTAKKNGIRTASKLPKRFHDLTRLLEKDDKVVKEFFENEIKS